MFGNLFLITDAANYNIALNQLSGSVYANYLNSFPSLGVHQNDLVAKATDCEVPALAGSVLECRASAPIHVWGQLDYQTRKMDGDVEAGDSRAKRFTGLLGVDASMGNSAIIGADIGYLTNNVRDHQFGDNAKGKGWTVGAYAVYDPGSFFLKGVTTYSSLNGDSTRHINFTGLGAGTGFTANPDGSPDVKMWTFGLHGGARLPMGATSVITPYLNWDYVNAKLQGFSEDNGNGAELTVDGSKSNHSYLTGGVKWATQMGGVVPELNLGYRYRFGNSRSSFHGWFTPDPENDFDILSSAQKKGTFLAGLSVGGKMGPVDLRIGYEGEFNGSVTSHSGNFKIVVPLGGHAAPPPPPPAPPPPPPPPPPPATQTCPDGSVILATDQCPAPPPPPPPPAPAPERGQ
jgi:trimeric autotransporter adhesin